MCSSDLNSAEKLLDKATGSYLGAGVAKGKQVFGISDESTQANQQLKLISGWMVANVPRMEGPQSNYDVENYKIMAAQVGDPTVPVEDRKAALKQLNTLQNKYKYNPQGIVPKPSGAAGGWSIKKVP